MWKKTPKKPNILQQTVAPDLLEGREALDTYFGPPNLQLSQETGSISFTAV